MIWFTPEPPDNTILCSHAQGHIMTDTPAVSGLSYRDAGVDIDAGNALIERIKPLAARTRRPEVMAGLGGFGALFELPLERYRRPVLVSEDICMPGQFQSSNLFSDPRCRACSHR